MSRLSRRHRSLVAASFASALGAEPASAATFLVDSASALVAAVASANATPSTDRIVLTADVTLDAVADVTWGPSGLPNVTTPIVVEGRGFTIRRDPAAPQFRILVVSGGFAGSGELTLDDVTIEGGDVTGGLDQVLNGGGGVLNFLGRLELRNQATFTDNAAYLGGAVGNRGDLVAADSHFAGNRATFGGALSSGGAAATTADVRRCVFDDNEAIQSGGAIYNTATATIVDATFTANRVTGASSFGGGGAIYNTTIQGDVTAVRSSFTGNSASRGGALANYNASDVTLVGCDVRDNETLPGGHGGGIWNTNNAALVVRDSRIEDNEAVGFGAGGGIHNGGPNSALTLEGSSVRGNAAGDGGGIFAQSSNVSVLSRIENSAIEDNTAGGDGGGLYKTGASPLTVAASSISNNRANGFNGAGIACDGGDLRIADSVITGNEGDSGLDGGGISNENAGTVLLERSTVSGNVTTGIGGISGRGGGIFNNQTGSTVTVRSSTISGNGAHYGGGLYTSNNSVTTLTSSTVTANVATSNSGGIHALAIGGLTILGSVVASNVAGTISASSGNNCGGFASGFTDAGGNFTDERGTVCPVTFAESASILLQPLADNGGRTPTHALGAGSVAIDGGGACGLATDQRGVPRTGACDAGAFEAGPVLPTLALGAATITVAEESGATVQAGMRLDNTAGTLVGGTVTAYVSLTGTAADGIDYTVGTALPLLLAVPAPGASLNQSIAFTVQDDDVVEGTENVVLTLSLAGPARLGAQTTREIRIVEGEVAAFLQYRASQSKSEAQSGAGKLPPDHVVSLDDPSFPAFSSDGTTTEHYLVQKPTGLLLPGEDGVTPADLDGVHLLAYQLREAKQGVSDVLTSGGAFAKALRHPARTNVRVRNRFGDIVLDTTKVAALLVPAAKSTLGPVAAPAAGEDGVPHFKCFQAKATTSFDPAFEFGSQQDVRRRGRFLPVQATVLDQFADGAAHPLFGDARHYDLKKPRLYCNPAVLDAIDTTTLDGAGNPRKTTAVIAGPSTLLDPARTLLCYQAKTATKSAGAAIAPRQQKHARRSEAAGSALDVATQLVAPRLVDTRSEELLCVPSTLVDDGCAGKGGACTGP